MTPFSSIPKIYIFFDPRYDAKLTALPVTPKVEKILQRLLFNFLKYKEVNLDFTQ